MSNQPKTLEKFGNIREQARQAYGKLISDFDEDYKHRSHAVTKVMAADAVCVAPDLDPEALGLAFLIGASILLEFDGDSYGGAATVLARVGDVILTRVESGEPVHHWLMTVDAMREADGFVDIPELGDLLDRVEAKVKALVEAEEVST